MPNRRSRLYLPVGGAIAIVLLNTWFAFASLRVLQQNQDWLAHTWEVIGQVQHILSSAREGESSARGYVITGDESFLSPYYVARQQITKQIDAFKQLTRDNPNQRPNAELIAQATQDRFGQLDRIVQARRSDSADAARALISSGEGFREMARLRDTSVNMEHEERRLLAIRQSDVNRSYVTAVLAIALASGLDLILLLLTGRFLLRERGARIRMEAVNASLADANERIARTSTEIQQLNAELEERVRQRTAELESTNRELEAFSYSVSHDLRAPLRTIDGFSLALEEDYNEAVDDTGRDYIRRVRNGVQRMGSLIDSLLQLSRITRAELSRQDVDVSTLVQSVAQDLREQNPDQSLQFDIQPGMHTNADPQLLRVAFENLLGNAVKFSSKEPVSLISVSYEPATRAFTVGDNGAGFDMEYSSKLFNAFNRLHGDKDFKGSGIGLATVARVIRRHHGSISAESTVGHGARFRFTLG